MDAGDVTAQVWQGLGGDAGALDGLTLTGPEHVLPSAFSATVGVRGGRRVVATDRPASHRCRPSVPTT